MGRSVIGAKEMPLTFNAGSSFGFDWNAALSPPLMEARAAKSEKTVEQKAPVPAEEPKLQTPAEPAIRIDISDAAKTASTPVAPETVAAAVKEDAAPAAVSPIIEETTKAAAQAAAPLADLAEETASEAAAVTEQAVAKVTSFAGRAAALFSSLPDAEWLLADRGNDADWIREALKDKGSKSCISGRKSRAAPVKRRCKRRNRIENMFGRLKD